MSVPAAASSSSDAVHAAEAYYERELALGIDRFFDERRGSCPWCGSAALRHRATCRDLRQFKPGRFRLDECRECGHVFQNPAVTDEGLTFYYRDTYDGLNAERMEENLASMAPTYLSRAQTVADHRPDPPRRWLDVGTSAGHFCGAAAQVFPSTAFDGLDMSDGVLAGQRAGRIENAYQGQFPELAEQLAGRYDQISMIHYLEHTRDPFADLDAAVTALSDDGWLLIEQPDPEARSARIFRSWWAGWNQPEHLHMVTERNLVAALEERGLEVVAVVHREAHIPLETFITLATLLNRLAPPSPMPWLGGWPPRFATLRRTLGKLLFAPLVPLALLVDRVVLPRLLRSYHAYRVLARVRPTT